VDQWDGDREGLESKIGHDCVACLNYQADQLKRFVASEDARTAEPDMWQLRRVVDDEHPDAGEVEFGALGYGRPNSVPLMLTDPIYGRGRVLEMLADLPCNDELKIGYILVGPLRSFPAANKFSIGRVDEHPELLDVTVAMMISTGHETTPVVVLQGSPTTPRSSNPGVYDALGRLYEPAIALEQLLAVKPTEVDCRALSGAGIFWANLWVCGALADLTAGRTTEESVVGGPLDPLRWYNDAIEEADFTDADSALFGGDIGGTLLSSWSSTQSLAIDVAPVTSFTKCVLGLDSDAIKFLNHRLFARLTLSLLPSIDESLKLLGSFDYRLADQIAATIAERGWLGDDQPEEIGVTRLTVFDASLACPNDGCEQGAAK
jgi:hypothetical protein